MKRVLIISDNHSLTSFMLSLVERDLRAIAKFIFFYSSVNKSPDKMIDLGSNPIDVKDKKTIDWIVTNFDFVFSVHCKQIFPKNLISKVKCVNVHPGLNPYNRGWYPQVFSIINKKPIGATIHLMDEEIDNGLIIAQKKIDIDEHDTSFTLYKKIQIAEMRLLEQYTKAILLNEAVCQSPQEKGNYNSVLDFRKLCCLDMNNIGTLKEHIDLLRALSHEGFNNAFFYNKDGVKVFVSIQMKIENVQQI